jgi:heme/copper-type cytochrome/quinol oxidase subunit 4
MRHRFRKSKVIFGRNEVMGTDKPASERTHTSRMARPFIIFFALSVALTQVPTVSAHGGSEGTSLSQLHAVAIMSIGTILISLFVIFKRYDQVSTTKSLYGVFFGISITVIGAIIFEGLAPDPTFGADTMPFPRAWFQPISLVTGGLILLGSLIIGWVRWPTRPRYMLFGVLMSMWVAYSSLLPQPASYWNPLGYIVVLATPVLVGYILWKDAGTAIFAILRDPVARRFGLGVGLLTSLFFMSASGYLSFFWEEGFPEKTTAVVVPAVYELVMWPTLEVAIPRIPLFFAISPGSIIAMGLLGGLVGLNAAVIARYWRADQRAGTTQTTAGTATLVGACTCGCCGPLVSQFALYAASPSIAAPLYWIFIDSSSPLTSLFIIASVLLFTATLIKSTRSIPESTQSISGPAAETA